MCYGKVPTQYHEHKPYEECEVRCPHPHMTSAQAEEWWERYNNAYDDMKRRKIEEEALPTSERSKTLVRIHA